MLLPEKGEMEIGKPRCPLQTAEEQVIVSGLGMAVLQQVLMCVPLHARQCGETLGAPRGRGNFWPHDVGQWFLPPGQDNGVSDQTRDTAHPSM